MPQPHLYQLIAINKIYSWILIFLITALLTIVGAFTWGIFGILFALIISVLLSLISLFYGDAIVMQLMGAEKANPDEFRTLHNIIEEMSLASGLPKPKVFVIRSNASNAFATGRNPQNASIAVTTGIMEILNREELQGVIGHEMSHIRHRDTLYAVLMGVMVGAIVILCDSFRRSLRWGGLRRRSGKGSGQAAAIILVVAIILSILAPIFAQIIKFAMSRRREYLADNGGAELTRNPLALAKALEKISGDPDPLDIANRGVQHLFIINPLNSARQESKLHSLFSTHPPVNERVKILKELAHEYSEKAIKEPLQ
ncbi:MAG: M48 family metallopeptidase [Planctomycetes bacterium]|nr:M48 family metallopeptidase [Planctomycetota bacterium]